MDPLFEHPQAAEVLAEALSEAILLEDPARRILITNPAFHALFGIPVPPAALRGVDCAAAAQGSAVLFTDPVAFAARIDQILAQRVTVRGERLTMTDGRQLSRDFLPLANGGTLWVYREVEPGGAPDLGALAAAVAALPGGPAAAAVRAELARLTGAPGDVLPADLDPDVRELLPMYVEGRREELARLQASDDLDVARRIGHQLKGTGATFGLPAVGELGRRLEQAALADDPAEVAACVHALTDLIDRIERAL